MKIIMNKDMMMRKNMMKMKNRMEKGKMNREMRGKKERIDSASSRLWKKMERVIRRNLIEIGK
jgi:hypothetical protein